MNEPSPPDPTIRPPTAVEVSRATYLFRGARLRPDAQFLVAVRTRPVERFIAAVTWWSVGKIVCFQLASQPGIARAATCALLVARLAETARAAGMEFLQYGESLAEGSEWINLLRDNGFTLLRSERFFEVAVAESWTRTVESYEKHHARIPATWRTEAIRHHAPEIIFDLVAPFRLMPPAEVRDYWRPDAFDLDLSSILFDGGLPFGTLLARRAVDSLFIDIRVVTHENQVLRALGNVLLFRHMAVQREQNQRIQWLKFRGGATEHRETANLARRMEGREMPPRHIYSRTL
jgi:hypothetical protein